LPAQRNAIVNNSPLYQAMSYIDTANLDACLQDEHALASRGLERRVAGHVNLSSGRVVACDPLVQPNREPFARQVAARSHCQVDVLGAAVPVLAALWLVEPRSAQPGQLQWSLALLEDQDAAALGADEAYGFPVGTGTGCFMDADATAAIALRDRREEERAGDNYISYYDNVLASDLEAAGTWELVQHEPLPGESPARLVLFRSGWGDGSYPCYWGCRADGTPVVLVIDFMVIEGGDARRDDQK
jgi:hypothetical protein